MNNKEFISKLSQRCKYTPADTAFMTEGLVTIISDCLKDGDQINVSGFGGFEAKMRRERISVNPKTGQRMLVPPKIVPFFHPSAKIKDKFKETE